MKLINHLIIRITASFTLVMLLWSACYFVLQMKEIHDGNDEGLTNLKQEFIAKANTIAGFVERLEANAPLNLTIHEIPFEEAAGLTEHFSTTGVYFATELEEEEVRMLTTAFRCEQNGKYYRLQFFTSTVESDDLIKNMLYLLLGLWVAFSLTLFTVSKVIISNANKPFYALLEKLKKFRLDNRQMIDFPETKIVEYAQLNESVKELLKKNISVFEEQKIFIENTSHELQTPLALAAAKLELLMESSQSNRHYTEELAAVLAILHRMKRLNSSLLLLSKIQNRQFPKAEPVDLQEILDSAIADFEDIAAYKQVALKKEGHGAPTVLMSRDLAYILLSNLIKNAVVHNAAGGWVAITCSTGSITIANSGEVAIADVFGRYQSATAGEKSSHLGLSIVKSIADLYRIQLSYRYDHMHVFTLKA
jgi:signal transduction histidine kinase